MLIGNHKFPLLERILACLVVVMAICYVCWATIREYRICQVESTARLCGTLASQCATQDLSEDKVGSVLAGKEDAWGNEFRYKRVVDEYAAYYVVGSAGRDGQFDTADDIMVIKYDKNTARIVGEYVGSRTKEALTGLVNGIKNKTKFSGKQP